MTERRTPRGSSARRGGALVGAAVLAAGAACAPAPRDLAPVGAYYAWDFPEARDVLRDKASRGRDEDVVLDTLRLGVAALADGATDEAERAFTASFELLTSAGLNADRTTSAILVNDGVRIWKGEPFEQALGFWWIAAHYAVRGDWENTRAAIANAGFRLADFGADRDEMDVARDAARDPDILESGYTAVENDFALGQLMLGLASSRVRAGGADDAFDRAVAIDPSLGELVARLRAGDFDTLLLIDHGKGPTKVTYGPDDVLTEWAPQDMGRPRIAVRAGDGPVETWPPVCDVNALAADFRWNATEDARKAKAAIGRTLEFGGAILASAGGSGESRRNRELAGLGMILAGALLRSGSAADLRYNEFAPQVVFVVPLSLGETTDVRLDVDDPERGVIGRLRIPRCVPGTPTAPRTIYLRMLGPGSPEPPWLRAADVPFGNDHAPPPPGALPWLVGGFDARTPNRAVLADWRAAGLDPAVTLEQVLAAHRAEGVVLDPDRAAGRERERAFRHVLDGGAGLFTPAPDSIGYRRIMGGNHASHVPQSDEARALAARFDTARAAPAAPGRSGSPGSPSAPRPSVRTDPPSDQEFGP